MRRPWLGLVLAVASALVCGSAGVASAIPAPAGGDAARPAIIGGRVSTDVYPFMASLQEKSGFPFCGGTLVAPTWIITAKHCVQWQKDVHARLGSDNRSDGGEVIDVASTVLHKDADLALLQLASPASGTPLSIPASTPAPGTPLRLLGWGMMCTDSTVCSYPQALHEVDVTRAQDSACTNALIPGKEMCLGEAGAGACHGDSGGPALVKQGDGWAVVGATDRLGVHTQTGYCGQSGVIYEDLTAFRDWVSQTIGGGSTLTRR